MDKSITVERVRHALVVGRLDTDGAAVLLAANLPAKRDRTFVVVGASSVDAMTRLDPWLLADLADEVRGDLCVVAPGFGAMGTDGKLPPARLLADRLGVEVTAADGDPVGLADGSVFVPGRTAGWVSYRPGGQRIRVGARLPAPWWQDGLPAPEDHLTHVPVGLWVRRPGTPERPDDPLLRGVPDHDRMYVVVGAPGEEPPSSALVAEVLRALPDEGRDRAVLAWYGTGGLAQEVADELNAPVRAAHGVPGDGGLVYVDGTGVARWRPFAVESVYRPGGAPVLDRWVAPPGLAMAGPGTYRLTDGWCVDVVPRGLVVRPESVAVTGFSAVDTGPAAEVVFAVDGGGPVPVEVLSAFDHLLHALPDDTREMLRILPVDEQAEQALATAAAADRVVSVAAQQPVTAAEPEEETGPPTGAVVVTANGRILPAEPVLAVPSTHPASIDIQDGVLTIDLPEEEGIPTVAAATVAPSVIPQSPVIPLPGSPTHPRLSSIAGAGEVGSGMSVVWATPVPVMPAAASAGTALTGAAEAPPAAAVAGPLPADPPASSSPTPVAAMPAPTAVPAPPAVPTSPAVAAFGAEPAGVVPAATMPTSPAAAAVSVGAVPAAGTSAGTGVPAAFEGQLPVPSALTSVASVPTVSAVTAPPVSTADADSTVDSVAGLLPGREASPPAVAAPVEVPEDARSTAEQRRAMRGKLGSRYDVATRAVTQLLSERPGLRFGTGDRAALLTELAVVRVFADEPDGDYDADFYTCLADGLRRLPTARTVVVRGIPQDTDLRPESVLRLPTPVVAASLATGDVGPAEALIWTTTARRLDGFFDEETAEVVLSGHTRLRVLAVEDRRVLLAEDGCAPDAALTRLRAAAAARAVSADPPATSRWFGPLPAA